MSLERQNNLESQIRTDRQEEIPSLSNLMWFEQARDKRNNPSQNAAVANVHSAKLEIVDGNGKWSAALAMGDNVPAKKSAMEERDERIKSCWEQVTKGTYTGWDDKMTFDRQCKDFDNAIRGKQTAAEGTALRFEYGVFLHKAGEHNSDMGLKALGKRWVEAAKECDKGAFYNSPERPGVLHQMERQAPVNLSTAASESYVDAAKRYLCLGKWIWPIAEEKDRAVQCITCSYLANKEATIDLVEKLKPGLSSNEAKVLSDTFDKGVEAAEKRLMEDAKIKQAHEKERQAKEQEKLIEQQTKALKELKERVERLEKELKERERLQ